jgi:hypothetical protein
LYTINFFLSSELKKTNNTSISSSASKKQYNFAHNKIQNGFLTNTRHARFYANRGFTHEFEASKISYSEALDQDPMNDISSLENLIYWQKKELEDLQEEMTQFKSSWELKLRQLRQRHCSQRRQVLQMVEESKPKNNEKTEDEGVGASPVNIYQV